MGISIIIICKEMGYINGKTARYLMANGIRGKCMDKENYMMTKELFNRVFGRRDVLKELSSNDLNYIINLVRRILKHYLLLEFIRIFCYEYAEICLVCES